MAVCTICTLKPHQYLKCLQKFIKYVSVEVEGKQSFYSCKSVLGYCLTLAFNCTSSYLARRLTPEDLAKGGKDCSKKELNKLLLIFLTCGMEFTVLF